MADQCCTVEEIRDAKCFHSLGGNLTWTKRGSGDYDDSIMQCQHGNLFLVCCTHYHDDDSEDVLCEPATVDDLKNVCVRQDQTIQGLYEDLRGEGLMNTLCQNCNKCFKGFLYEKCSCDKPMATSLEMYRSWYYQFNRGQELLRRRHKKLYTNDMNVHVVDDLKIYIYRMWKLDFKNVRGGYTFAKSDSPATERPYGHVNNFAQVKGKINGVKLTAEYKKGNVLIEVSQVEKGKLGRYSRGKEVLFETDNLWEFEKYVRVL